jgi:hypothetical protein
MERSLFMEQNSRDNNNFRALDGGSEKKDSGLKKRPPDTYVEVLSGKRGHAVRSESSYDNTGLAGEQEELGLSGAAGMNTNAGLFGNKGMSDI